MGRVDIYPTTTLQGPPSAQLGYAEVTASQTGISAETDLTSLAITVTVPVGRRIRITGQIQVQSATTSGTVLLRAKEGATVLQTSQENYNTIGGNGKYLTINVVITPTAGTHTYKFSLQGTTGTIDLVPASTIPAYILVEDITGTFWNGVPVTNPPACRVFHNTTQSIADNTVTTVLFNSERYDTDNMHNTVTNNSRITINTAGLYLLTFHGRVITAADYLALFCDFNVNAGSFSCAEMRWHPNTTGDVHNYQLTTVYKFAAGDFIEARVYQDNTANASRTLESTSAVTPEFSAAWVGLG